MTVFALGSLILILILFGIWEYQTHQIVLSRLPNRIHVNGSRGKSSVVRLIAAGLRAGGFKTIAKVTGTSPRVIDSLGKDRIIHRLRSPSIGEQLRLMRLLSHEKPDYLIMECMAVQPDYQWVSEHKMVRSQIGVITNVRPDHVDEMGYTVDDITHSLCNSIPDNGTLIATEGTTNDIIKNRAAQNNSDVVFCSGEDVPSETMHGFSYLEHRENVALALKVCDLAGVEKETALKGMTSAQPDPGALHIWKIGTNEHFNFFINAFAANDPESTFYIWKMLTEKVSNEKISVFLNTRSDRRYRTTQMAELIFSKLNPHLLIVRGDNLPDFSGFKNHSINEIKYFSESAKPNEIIKFITSLKNEYIMGIGNMVGWGESFMKELKLKRIND